MNHLLIAGGTGFIGYHLAYKLKQKGWKITSLSITKPKKKRIVKGVKYLLVDLTKKKLIKQKLSENYTHVINLSGHTSNLYSKKYKKKNI
jgi:nucleoside-diphosphate-sugar epimerase